MLKTNKMILAGFVGLRQDSHGELAAGYEQAPALAQTSLLSSGRPFQAMIYAKACNVRHLNKAPKVRKTILAWHMEFILACSLVGLFVRGPSEEVRQESQ